MDVFLAMTRLLDEERFVIGARTTGRLGARHDPDVALHALEESRSEVEELFSQYSIIILIGTGGKGTGSGTMFPLAQMAHHRRRAASFPTLGTSAQRGKLVVLLAAHAKAVGKATSQEKPMGQRVKDEGASEGRPVMGWIGVDPPFDSRWPRETWSSAWKGGDITPPERGQTSLGC